VATDRDAILKHLHAALREVRAAEALIAPDERSADVGEVGAARLSLETALDRITRQAFAEGTTRDLAIDRPLRLKKRDSDDE
jgi:hypothetical protein